MKYIKTYESLEVKLLSKFTKNIKKFGLEFFNEKNFDPGCKIKSFLYGKMMNFCEKDLVFFSIDLQVEDFLIIKMSEHYISRLGWKKSLEFKNYLISIIKSFSIEKNDSYYIKFEDVEELISKLNMEEYNFKKDANIYNL
jgi:hypothetical protein